MLDINLFCVLSVTQSQFRYYTITVPQFLALSITIPITFPQYTLTGLPTVEIHINIPPRQ